MEVQKVKMYSLDPHPTVRGPKGKYIPDTSGIPRIIEHTFQFFPNEYGKARYQKYLNKGFTYNRADLEPKAPLYVSDKE